jgi:hypothetical protein
VCRSGTHQDQDGYAGGAIGCSPCYTPNLVAMQGICTASPPTQDTQQMCFDDCLVARMFCMGNPDILNYGVTRDQLGSTSTLLVVCALANVWGDDGFPNPPNCLTCSSHGGGTFSPPPTPPPTPTLPPLPPTPTPTPTPTPPITPPLAPPPAGVAGVAGGILISLIFGAVAVGVTVMFCLKLGPFALKSIAPASNMYVDADAAGNPSASSSIYN